MNLAIFLPDGYLEEDVDRLLVEEELFTDSELHDLVDGVPASLILTY
jgi:hypothetical protein